MDIKPFVKRVFKAYRDGLKQPSFHQPEVLMPNGQKFLVFGFEIRRADMAESFWNEMAPSYEGELTSGRIVRVEKDLDANNRVLIGVYVPIKDEQTKPGQEIQEDTALPV